MARKKTESSAASSCSVVREYSLKKDSMKGRGRRGKCMIVGVMLRYPITVDAREAFFNALKPVSGQIALRDVNPVTNMSLTMRKTASS